MQEIKKNNNPVKKVALRVMRWLALDSFDEGSFFKRYAVAWLMLGITLLVVTFQAAQADFEVLESAKLNTSGDPSKSWWFAFRIVIVIHAVAWISSGLVAKNYATDKGTPLWRRWAVGLVPGWVLFQSLKHNHPGDRLMMRIALPLLHIVFFSSLYLTWNTDQVAEADAYSNKQRIEQQVKNREDKIKEEYSVPSFSRFDDEMESVRKAQDNIIQEAASAHDSHIAGLASKAKRYAKAKHSSWKPGQARKIREEYIPSAKAAKAKELAELEAAKASALAQIRERKNGKVEAATAKLDSALATLAHSKQEDLSHVEQALAVAKTSTLGKNIILMLFEVLLIWGLTHFYVYSLEELSPTVLAAGKKLSDNKKTGSGTTPPTVPDNLDDDDDSSGDNLEEEEGEQRDPHLEAQEIKRLEDHIRKCYERSFSSARESTRARNERKAYELAKELEEHFDIETTFDSEYKKANFHTTLKA